MNSEFLTNRVLMIEPVSFRLNKETAINNFYQQEDHTIPSEQIQNFALKEFLRLKEILKNNGIQVISVKDTINPITPDALFPNNWISFHPNKKVILYPMFAQNRRKERRLDILQLKDLKPSKIIDYTSKENQNIFLEGTGSMVLDRKNNIAYCSLSKRSDKNLFLQFCEENQYNPVYFTSFQTVNGKRQPIYHTNVMMSIGNQYAMICLEAIDDLKERENVMQSLKNSDKEIIKLTENQIAHFAGNTLQLKTKDSNLIVMSSQAKECLDNTQIRQIEKYGKIVATPIPIIEKFGGGSVRCMLAEIF